MKFLGIEKSLLTQSVVFTLSFLSLCYLFSYISIIDQHANGDHVWRQSDGLAITYCYYDSDNSLFEPKMLNQLSNNGKAVGEFPILYFVVAQLYKIFGPHDSIYRITCWLLCFLGYFALFRLITNVLNDFFLGIVISLLTFTSPILIYYGISFIPDPIALSFVFISWYFLQRSTDSKNFLFFVSSVFFMTMAALLKITCLISFFAIILSLIVSRKYSQKNLTSDWKIFPPVIMSFMIILGWIIYSRFYNSINQSAYFFLKIAPIWELPAEEIQVILHYISDWTREYFYPTGRHIIYIAGFLTLLPFFKTKLSKEYYFIFLFSVLGFLGFIILFFQQFKDHDYYMVTLLFIIPMTLTAFFQKFRHLIYTSGRSKIVSRLLILVLLIASSLFAKQRTDKRIEKRSEWVDEELYNINLASVGISKNDLVLAPLDPSPNISLYALKLKGWTGYNVEQSSIRINKKITQGARWMILPTNEVGNHSYLDQFLTNKKHEANGISIYDLSKFNPQN